MGQIRPPLPVKLFVGMLSTDSALFKACSEILQGEFGPIDAASEFMPWSGSGYYRDEMGPDILRMFLFFERSIDPGSLPSVKRFTNEVESKFAVNAGQGYRRKINLDPGYVTEAKVVLASSKDYAHRVYIGDGIYGEVTLKFDAKARSFISIVHTYPDFRTPAYLGLFNSVRDVLRKEIHKASLG